MCVVATVLLSGTSARPAPLHIRSIGVIAALGDTCMFERVRDTDFEWLAPPGASFLGISDWGIDDEVTNEIAKQLAPRIQVQAIPVEHQEFDTWTYDSLARHIRQLPLPETPVDAYLLLLRDWDHDAIGNTDHELGGLGLYRRDRRAGGSRFGVFAAFRLVLVDPNTGAVIDSRPALLPDGRLPWLPAGSSLWPRAPNDVTNAQRNQLRAGFLTLIDGALRRVLRQTGLES